MSTPPKATPTTPRWAITAAREITRDSFSHYYGGIAANYESEREAVSLAFATIIAKHAPPPAAQPSDAAGLREVIDREMEASAQTGIYEDLTDRILTALAPYLKGEPGDSELLDWLLDYITNHGLNGLKKLAWTCYDEDGESLMHRKTISEEEVGDCRFDRNSIRAAMRGERGAE